MRTIHVIVALCFASGYYAWRAIPANQAMYAERSRVSQFGVVVKRNVTPDYLLPRRALHSVFKFGFCTLDATSKKFLRKTTNYSLSSVRIPSNKFMYLIEDLNSLRFSLQCIVMKVYVPDKFQFKRTRMPFYFCTGYVHYLVLNAIHRLAIHEFYFANSFSLPASFVFEFYQPTPV